VAVQRFVLTVSGGNRAPVFGNVPQVVEAAEGGLVQFDVVAADPDADGVPNLLEYVLGGQPNLSDPGALLPALSRNTGGDYLFTFRRSDISQTGTSLVVQHSTNLVTWTDVPVGATSSGAVNVQQNTPSPDMDTITVTIANPGAAPCFARLRATAP
jgi:hypothetical protein